MLAYQRVCSIGRDSKGRERGKNYWKVVLVFRAVWLYCLALLDEPIVPETNEYILDNLGMLWRRGTSEYIEVNPEPIVYLFMNGMIFGAKLGRCHTFREGLGLSRSTVLFDMCK